MAYCSLPTGKLHKNENNNLPKNFEYDFYKNRLDSIDGSLDSNFQRSLVTNLRLSQDVKNFLLASNKLGQHM